MSLTVGIVDREEVDARRYRGMNPKFVRSVWAKRRLEQQQAPIAEPAPAAPSPVRWHLKPVTDEERIARLKRIIAGGGIRGIIAEVALARGFTFEDIVGDRRFIKLVEARHEAMAEVAKRMPHVTLTQMGRVFNRDHTTCLHAIEKMSKGVKTFRESR